MKKQTALTLGLILTGVAGLAVAMPALAACDPTAGLQGGISCAAGASGFASGTLQGNIKAIVNVLLLAVGIISVVMIIIGGIRYALSNGNESAINGAKNTIMYAIIGLVIAILAFAIVNFVTAIFGV